MSRTAVIVILVGGLAMCATAGPSPIQTGSVADDLLNKFAGSWSLSTSTWGLGFASNSFPGDKTPPTIVRRQSSSITLATRLQVDQGPYGAPVYDDFKFTLSHSGEAKYLLTIESASWLKIKDVALTLTNGSELRGQATLPFRDQPLPVTITIQLSSDGGHSWDFTQNQSNGKLLRSFGLKFARPVPAAGK